MTSIDNTSHDQRSFVSDVSEEIDAYWEQERFSFHMPGHKGGRVVHPHALTLIGEAAFRADISEVGGFDYLHAPTGRLQNAQAHAARLLGADRSFFLINGSTVGNIAAILTVVRPGDSILVCRGSHRSVFAGLTLAGVRPIYLEPIAHHEFQQYMGVHATPPTSVIQGEIPIKAIHITRPSAYGVCLDITPYRALAEKFNIPLLVDEAHGSHFAFHPRFPNSAIALGADLVIQSTHKTLTSLTQSSILHLRTGRIDVRRLENVLQMLQSSSPSALLLLSLDLAYQQMASDGYYLFEQIIKRADATRQQINSIPGLSCYSDDISHLTGVSAIDPTKLIIDVQGINMTGFSAAGWLKHQRKLGVEFADLYRIVCSLSLADNDETIDALLQGLQALAAHGSHKQPAESHAINSFPPAIPEMVLTLHEAFTAESHVVSFEKAVGHISADYLIPYPPGVPVIVPGERIDVQCAEYLMHMYTQGAVITGPEDPQLQSIRIIEDPLSRVV